MRKKTVTVIDVVEKEVVTQEDYDMMFRQYKILDFQEKQIKKQREKIKAQLDAYVDKKATPDNRGNRYFSFLDDEGKEVYYKREMRKSYSIKDEEQAADFFENKGLTDCFGVVQKVVFDEDAIAQHVASGDITIEDMKMLYNEKQTVASKIVSKKEVEEAQNGN